MHEDAKTQPLSIPQDAESWKTFWNYRGQRWRTHPEIDGTRQQELTHKRSIITDVARDAYPFEQVKLQRADIEWLLATHQSEHIYGPVDYDNYRQSRRSGIDICGANLAEQDLSNLPLAKVIGAYTPQATTASQKRSVVLNLDKADLTETHLEEANLMGCRLRKAYLRGAFLEKAHLHDANLESADFGEAHLEEAEFTRANLAEASLRQVIAEDADFSETRLVGANFNEAHLEATNFRGAYLKQTKFIKAHLEGADFRKVRIDEEGTSFKGAFLEGVDFTGAHLERADFSETHLEGADFAGAFLEGADFTAAHLEGTNFREAHLEDTDFTAAHLEGKILPDEDFRRIRKWSSYFQEQLAPADLREALLSSTTRFKDSVLGTRELGFVSVADMSWGDVNLNLIDWDKIPQLGDEYRAEQARREKVDRARQLEECRTAVRANRQLAVNLQDQGLDEAAARFSYRGQRLQRTVFFYQRKWEQYLFSCLLDMLTGYGYRPIRSFIAYLIVDIVFAAIYHTLDPQLSWIRAFLVSVTTFGRGLTPGDSTFSDIIVFISLFQAFIGLIIEATFIAALTQRFFGK